MNILYRKQKRQKSLDNGVTWVDTGEYRVGDILENPSNCTSEDSKQCRWVELPETEGYYCDGYNKYTVQVEECTENGIIWTRTGNQQKGNTLIESNSTDCGGWTEFDPVYFSCFLNNIKNAELPETIIDTWKNMPLSSVYNVCDLNNNYLFWNSSNGVTIINIKNGEKIFKNDAYVFILDIEDSSEYIYSTEIGRYSGDMDANIFKSIFITDNGNSFTIQKFNGSGFDDLYSATVNNFHTGYAHIISTTNNYVYLWIQTFGVIRIDKGTLNCTKVTTDDSLKKIPNELIKTINGEEYYLAIEVGDYQCYYSPSGVEHTITYGYLNGEQIDFKLNFRIGNHLIGNEWYEVSNSVYSGYNKTYIYNNNIYKVTTRIEGFFACMGDNSYITLGYVNGTYQDFSDNTYKVNSNIFSQKIWQTFYSKKYKVLFGLDGTVYDSNGNTTTYDGLDDCIFGYGFLNHIYKNGVVEFVNKLDEDCKEDYSDDKFYLVSYKDIVKKFDDFMDSYLG